MSRYHVPACLAISNPSFDQSVNLATQIHALYPNDDLEAIFEIKEARWFPALPEFGIDELEKMSALESLGINFYVASLGSCTVPCEPEYRLPVLKTLRQQLVVPAAVHQEMNVHGASSLTISSRGRSSVAYPTPSYWVLALFSAAHSSVSLSHIVVDAPFADLRSDGRLQWLVYAAVWKRSKLKQLKLNYRDIEMRDVAAIREMLQTTDPLRLILGGCEAATTSSHTMTTQVIGSRFHLCEPRAAAKNESGRIFSPPELSGMILSPLEPIAVDVIRAANGDEEMVQVMLPGHGVAWVCREDIVSEESRESVDQLPSTPAAIVLSSASMMTPEKVKVLLLGRLRGSYDALRTLKFVDTDRARWR